MFTSAVNDSVGSIAKLSSLISVCLSFSLSFVKPFISFLCFLAFFANSLYFFAPDKRFPDSLWTVEMLPSRCRMIKWRKYTLLISLYMYVSYQTYLTGVTDKLNGFNLEWSGSLTYQFFHFENNTTWNLEETDNSIYRRFISKLFGNLKWYRNEQPNPDSILDKLGMHTS